jgi:hypothetical protein
MLHQRLVVRVPLQRTLRLLNAPAVATTPKNATTVTSPSPW